MSPVAPSPPQHHEAAPSVCRRCSEGGSPHPLTRIRASRSPAEGAGRRESRCRILLQTETLTVSLGGLFPGALPSPTAAPPPSLPGSRGRGLCYRLACRRARLYRLLLFLGKPLRGRRVAPGVAQDHGAGAGSPSATVNHFPAHTCVRELGPGTEGSRLRGAVTASPHYLWGRRKKTARKETFYLFCSFSACAWGRVFV